MTGGKWTTHRAMAEDVLENAFEKRLPPRSAHGVTQTCPRWARKPGTAASRICDAQAGTATALMQPWAQVRPRQARVDSGLE